MSSTSRSKQDQKDKKNNKQSSKSHDKQVDVDHLDTHLNRDQENQDYGDLLDDDNYRSTDMRDSKMMARLLDALEEGTDIGHYGHLVFVMVARFFLKDDEIVALLMKQPDMEEEEARSMLLQVKAHDYNPPRRNRILQWQAHQDFQICEETDDPNGCNVYRELKFPDHIYNNIEDFWEEQVESEDES